jgi:SNF2 family DNA or RNA helicase
MFALKNAVPKEFLYNLASKVRLCFVDECQVARNIESTFSHSIQGLQAQYHVLLTATPVLWGVTSFSSLLALMHNPVLNKEAREAHFNQNLKNPYLKDASPEEQYFLVTHEAFSQFVKNNNTLAY